MPNDPAAPADTDMMRVVHDALRRDLRRARAVVGAGSPPDPLQVAAVCDHLTWMMSFLEAHHRSEDRGLYPVVRERDPSVAALLDDMTADHETIARRVDEVRRAAADRRPAEVAEAIDQLTESLLPHLTREEDELMPATSRVVTTAEWRDIEQRHNLDGKSVRQLAREGHWLIDGATPEDRKRVLGLVPPLSRPLMVYGFGPSYRRMSRACWNPRQRLPHTDAVSVDVHVELDAVWDLVRDPTRVGEWSHECTTAEWIGRSAVAEPGARFRGRNRQGPFRWGRVCEVISAEPYELVWRTVPTRLYPDSTEWTIRLTPVDGATRIEQRYQVVKGTVLEPVYAMFIPAHRDRTEALRADLRRIGETAAATGRASVGSAPSRRPRVADAG